MREYHATGPDLRPTENPDVMTGDEAIPGILENEPDSGDSIDNTVAGQTQDQLERKIEQETQAQVMQMGRQVISESTTYLDSNYRAQWQKNLALFHGEHPAGSKYHTKAYTHRSKSFRPLTRANVRRIEAACSSAFFSTQSPTKVTARNQSDPVQLATAAIYDKIMEYRLTHEDMNYYQFLLGAIQDAQVMGAAVSHNYWSYEVDSEGKVIEDMLKTELVPLERFRVHPDADWLDPVRSSPYIVHEMDMSVDKVRLKMMNEGWFWEPESAILAATRSHDATETAREKGKNTDASHSSPIPGHTTVAVHKIISREMGIDYIFYMLGSNHLLTMPRRLDEVNPDGMRNYGFGIVILESHRTIPAGNVELGQDLQGLANDISNQRIDNVRLAMNKRWILRRGRNIDVRALMRNVPGGATYTQDPEKDVREITTQDVTSSAYQEQDRVNLDMDQINGGFNASSVQSNRSMNETVGGMELMTGDSNSMTEYIIKLFAETFVKRTNRQQLKLIQAYETDMVVMLNAMNAAAKDLIRYGVTQVTDDMLNQELVCKVDVGIDATNPEKGLQKLMAGVNISAGLGNPIKPESVHNAAFGLLGYGDGTQFLFSEEEIQQQQQQQQASPEQMAAEQQAQSDKIKLQIAELNYQTAMNNMQMQISVKDSELELKRELEFAKMALEREMTLEQLHANLGIESAKIATQRDIAAVNSLQQESAQELQRSLEVFKAGEQAKQADKQMKAKADQPAPSNAPA